MWGHVIQASLTLGITQSLIMQLKPLRYESKYGQIPSEWIFEQFKNT